MKKNKVFIIIIIALTLIFSGCDDFSLYRGEHPELLVVATNSLIFAKIHTIDQIEILEEDNYGRTLFTFTGNSFEESEQLSVLICQKSDTNNSYYYEDINYQILQNHNELSEDTLRMLKEKNDWNKPLKEDELMKAVPILRKEVSDTISEKKQKELFSQLFSETYFRPGYSIYLTTDKYGRKIYCAKGVIEYGNLYTPSVFMMFNPDESYNVEIGIKEISDLNNYQEELIAFKELNSWNQPI